MGSRRTDSRTFQLQALDLARSGQTSISQIERECGITPGLLHKWQARMKADGQHAFPGKGHLKEEEELIRQLKRENEVLRQERDIPKTYNEVGSEVHGRSGVNTGWRPLVPKMGAAHPYALTDGSCR